MCSRIKQNTQVLQPGCIVTFTPFDSREPLTARWGSPRGVSGMPPFARSETLQAKWLSRGWQVGKLRTEGVAERADTGELRWSSKPISIKVVYHKTPYGDCQLAVVTRHASSREQAFFGHNRVPVVVWVIRSATTSGPITEEV